MDDTLDDGPDAATDENDESPSTTETGARFAKRNAVVANDFSIARSIWNMHDALLIEQRRTNQLLEWIGGILQTRSEGRSEGTPDIGG